MGFMHPAHELQKCIEPMASSSSPPPTKEGSLLDIFSHASEYLEQGNIVEDRGSVADL